MLTRGLPGWWAGSAGQAPLQQREKKCSTKLVLEMQSGLTAAHGTLTSGCRNLSGTLSSLLLYCRLQSRKNKKKLVFLFSLHKMPMQKRGQTVISGKKNLSYSQQHARLIWFWGVFPREHTGALTTDCGALDTTVEALSSSRRKGGAQQSPWVLRSECRWHEDHGEL